MPSKKFHSLFLIFYSILLLSTASITHANPQQVEIQQQIPLAGAKQNQQFALTNPINQQQYLIQVFKPKVPAPKAGYPVVYLLDGNAAFPYASVIAQSIEFGYQRNKKVPPVVVAIGYPIDGTIDVKSRTFDYTPPFKGILQQHPDRPASPYPQGGAEQFYQFIQQQLKPVIAQHYQINHEQQTLFGHSYGGLFTLYTFLNYPESFQNYVAASPAIWWNDFAIKTQAEKFTNQFKQKHINKTLWLSVGELELKKRVQTTNRHTASDIVQLADQLKNIKGLHVKTFEIAQVTHFEAMFPAINLAFKLAESGFTPSD
ncbi:alpha/beta hydrolase [Acinetobacter puyangensis]|uniref:alpha/beta hydrolase n=1 Tax=Acinetobacter puyangensis TaxID=1096779 RepID=UPI003A4D1CFD